MAYLNDTQAMNNIHAALDKANWSPDTLDFIADVVRRTGREIGDMEESGG